MPRLPCPFWILLAFAAAGCATEPEPTRPMSHLTRQAIEMVEAARERDREICGAEHGDAGNAYDDCLAARRDERKEWYRDTRRALQEHRLGPQRGYCFSPGTRDLTICQDI